MINRGPILLTAGEELAIFDENDSAYDVLRWLIDEVSYDEVFACILELGEEYDD